MTDFLYQHIEDGRFAAVRADTWEQSQHLLAGATGHPKDWEAVQGEPPEVFQDGDVAIDRYGVWDARDGFDPRTLR